MSADWQAVHALLAEHFEISLGRANTGFQVIAHDPVVIVHNFADDSRTRNMTKRHRERVRDRMLAQYEVRLNDAGYPTRWGVEVRSRERALIVMEKD